MPNKLKNDKNHMSNQKKLEIEVEETVTLSQKVGLITGVICAFLIGIVFVLSLFPLAQETQKIAPPESKSKETELLGNKLEEDDFSQTEILIKFKTSVLEQKDKEQKIKDIIDKTLTQPLAVLPTKTQTIPPNIKENTSPQTVKAESKEIAQLFTDQVSPQKIKDKFEQRSLRIPKDVKEVPDLSGWYVLKLKDKIDKGAIKSLIARLKIKTEIEVVEPNYIIHTNLIPNDPYYSSSGSWGQSYDDLWGLKKINVERAWNVIYAKRGDINNDGLDEIVIAVRDKGGPHVRIFGRARKGVINLIHSGFFAFSPRFRGGVTLATADIDFDNKAEIVTGVGSQSDALIRTFNNNGSIIKSEFYAYPKTYRNGVQISAGEY